MDAGPQSFLGIQTLRMQVAEQLTALERHRLAILEMVDRRMRNETNIAAARLAITELEKVPPNGAVSTQRRRMEIAAQQHTIERQILENLEGAERAARSADAITSTHEALARYRHDLAAMENAHGKLTEEAFTDLVLKVKEV